VGGIAFVVLIVMAAGCGEWPSGGEGGLHPGFETEILEVQVEPNPVIQGDTTTFTCIMRDSLDTRFRFRWATNPPGLTTTEENQLHWIASKNPGTHTFSVAADNGDPNRVSPIEEFHVTIIGE
jgi:hypothetical protein